VKGGKRTVSLRGKAAVEKRVPVHVIIIAPLGRRSGAERAGKGKGKR